MEFLWPILLILVNAVGVVLAALGLPGTWLMVLASATYAYFGAELTMTLGWGVVVVLVLLAGLGELAEFLSGAWGASRAGASRRSMVLALGGSLGGALVGLLVGLPIPVIGSLAGALLFSAVGALAGGVLGEQWKGSSAGRSWRVGQAAFWGRLVGTLGKLLFAVLMFVVSLAALFA